MNVAICISTFNRVAITGKCLDLIPAALGGIHYRVFITDGGSSDGTIDFLASRGEVDLALEPGTYWNRGMFSSISRALNENPDYILLLNDDVFLFPNSLAKLVAIGQSRPNSIIVGETTSSGDGRTIAGRIRKADRISKIALQRMEIGDSGPAVTFHGNCVLIPIEAMKRLGNLDPYFTHALGDTDLGLRATSIGIPILAIGESVGNCLPNHQIPTTDSRLSSSFWRRVLFDPKLVPVNEWLYFCRRHSGLLWPVNFIMRYLRIALRGN